MFVGVTIKPAVLADPRLGKSAAEIAKKFPKVFRREYVYPFYMCRTENLYEALERFRADHYLRIRESAHLAEADALPGGIVVSFMFVAKFMLPGGGGWTVMGAEFCFYPRLLEELRSMDVRQARETLSSLVSMADGHIAEIGFQTGLEAAEADREEAEAFLRERVENNDGAGVDLNEVVYIEVQKENE